MTRSEMIQKVREMARKHTAAGHSMAGSFYKIDEELGDIYVREQRTFLRRNARLQGELDGWNGKDRSATYATEQDSGVFYAYRDGYRDGCKAVREHDERAYRLYNI